MKENYNVDREIEKLKEYSENYKKYGTHEIPQAKTKQELFEQLNLAKVFEQVAELKLETKNEIIRIDKDKRYKDEYKVEHKKEALAKFEAVQKSLFAQVKSRLEAYKRDLVRKDKPPVNPIQESLQRNNSLLELAFLREMNNTKLIKDFIDRNYNDQQIMALINEQYKADADIQVHLHNKKMEAEAPYKVINECLQDIEVLLVNSDLVMDGNYMQDGLGKFKKIYQLGKYDAAKEENKQEMKALYDKFGDDAHGKSK